MHQVSKAFRVAAAILVAAVATACTTDRVASPPRLAHSAAVNDSTARVLLQDAATLKRILVSDNFHADLSPGDATGIEQRRQQVEGLLEQVQSRLQSPQQGPNFDDTDALPPCWVNGNLNNCIVVAQHTIGIDGTGHLTQASTVSAAQSAVVAITLDGKAPQNVSVNGTGFSIQTFALDQDFSWTQSDPYCNSSAHTATSTATHSISQGILGPTSISGVKNEPSAGASCLLRALTVSVSPSRINLSNGSATVTVTGSTDCVTASVTSSNSSVADADGGDGTHFTVFPSAVGTVSFTGICGTQRGTSGTLTVYDSTEDCQQLGTTSVSSGAIHTHTVPCSPGDGTTGGGTTSDPSCGFYQYFISFDDGVTWAPEGSPFWYCPDGSLAEDAIGHVASKGSSSGPQSDYKVTLFGTTIEGPQKVIAYTDLQVHGNPVVVVDTSRATSMDLEAVLQAISQVTNFVPPGPSATGMRFQALKAPTSAAAQQHAAAEDTQFLHDLLNANVQSVKSLGNGRLLEVTITRSSSGTTKH